MESEIVHECLKIINETYSNNYISFYSWLTYNSDIDFITIYQRAFEKHSFNRDQIVKFNQIMINNAHNLANAAWSFYEVERDIAKLNNFIKRVISCQIRELI
jgi:hypothetical protein